MVIVIFLAYVFSAHLQVLCAVHDKKWMKFKFDEGVNIYRHL
jgi:hypothetical protein